MIIWDGIDSRHVPSASNRKKSRPPNQRGFDIFLIVAGSERHPVREYIVRLLNRPREICSCGSFAAPCDCPKNALRPLNF